ncbi:hypothetical protein STEG23_006795, partial [Scotinomys teguina]
PLGVNSRTMWTLALWVFPVLCKCSLAALPAKPENISCILYFEKNMTCTWSPEETSDTNYTVKMTYSFGKKSCTAYVTKATCSFSSPCALPPDNCSIEVEAQNGDGKVKSDITYWDLDHIVHTSVQDCQQYPLEIFYTSELRRHASMSFSIGRNDITFCFGDPHTMKTVNNLHATCPGLWRVLGPVDVNGTRKVLLLWKKARGAPVLERTLGYNIQYFPENTTNLTEINNVTNQQYALLLTGQSYCVSVTSFNSLGKSQEAILRIPAVDEKTIQCIRDMKPHLAEPLLVLKWQSLNTEVDTWMVEWLPETAESKFSGLSWESVSQVTNWTIEQAPSRGPKTRVENIGLKTATVIWEEIPKSKRNGFINNYTIFYQAEGGKEFSKTVNAHVLQFDLESLTRRTSYTVRVVASTQAGGTSGKTINFRTSSISIFEIILLTSLVGGGLLLLSIFTVTSALKKPNRLTRLCCPDVPNPAESSLATWTGDNFKGKSSQKESENSGNTEDRVLKPCSVPADLVDKLMVNFENFLEVVSTEEARKGQESILGGEENEYVTSPSRPDCPPGKSFKESSVLTKVTPGDTYNQCLGTTDETYTEFNEQLMSSSHSPDGEPLCEEQAPNPYLKNSVTTREFLIPEHTKKEI